MHDYFESGDLNRLSYQAVKPDYTPWWWSFDAVFILMKPTHYKSLMHLIENETRLFQSSDAGAMFTFCMNVSEKFCNLLKTN
jgi:hypothetical protein